MSLMDRRKEFEQRREALIKAKAERAKNAAMEVINSPQFQMNLLSLPESKMAVDNLVNATVRSVTDPVGDFLDVMKAKGFRQAEIRNIVHKLYNVYCLTIEQNSDDTVYTYEMMLPKVAEYVYAHQELYNTLNPEDLRA